jgi:acetyltransferase-like isoleucine patch superfamily enzyme
MSRSSNDSLSSLWLRPVPSAIEPFSRRASETAVLGRPLSAWHNETAKHCGLAVVREQPDGPHLVIDDDLWFVPALISAFLLRCPASGGRLALSASDPWVSQYATLQNLDGDDLLVVGIAVVPSKGSELVSLPLVEIDLQTQMHAMGAVHPAFSHAWPEELPVTRLPVIRMRHWTHILQANQVALLAYGLSKKREFDQATWIGKLWRALLVLAKARSLNRWRIASALTTVGKRCSIHPSAVVEACVLGDDVEIGPHAVVRGSWLGNGVKVSSHARVNLSIVEKNAELGRGVMANMVLLMEQAFLSQGFGFQASVLGQSSFVAMGACFYDLSFGGEVKVEDEKVWRSVGGHFMGSCIGDDAKIGPNVTIGYGESVPAGAFLVANPSMVLRRIPSGLPPGVPHYCEAGKVVPVVRKKD